MSDTFIYSATYTPASPDQEEVDVIVEFEVTDWGYPASYSNIDGGYPAEGPEVQVTDVTIDEDFPWEGSEPWKADAACHAWADGLSGELGQYALEQQ